MTYREVRMTDDRVHVEHEFDDYVSSGVTIEAVHEKTTITVTHVRLEVGGRASGYQARLSFKGKTLWEGDYTEVKA